jgi:Ca2+-binding RTX toxin-like protein
MSLTVSTDPQFTLRLAPGSDSGLDGTDNITNVKNPVFIGLAAPGATIYLENHYSLVQDGATTADEQGNWTFAFGELINPDGDGDFPIRFSVSQSSYRILNLFLDTAPPTLFVTPATPGEHGTSVLVQSNEAGKAFLIREAAVVDTYADILRFGGAEQYKAVTFSATESSNVFSADIRLDLLRDDTYKVYAVDVAGNISSSTETITIENTRPNVSFQATHFGSLHNPSSGLSNVVQVDGSEPGVAYLVKESVDVRTLTDLEGISDPKVFRTSPLVTDVAVDPVSGPVSHGGFSLQILDEGIYYAYAVDNAGNISVRSTSTVTIDRTPPAAAAPKLRSSSDSGVEDDDNITNVDTNLVFLVKGEAADTVMLSEKFEDVPYQPPLDTIGTYDIELEGWLVKVQGTMASGPHTIIARVTDLAGNYVAYTGPASTSPVAMSFTIDTTAPDAPVITSTPFTNNYSATAQSDDTARIYLVNNLLYVTSLADITAAQNATPEYVSMAPVTISSGSVKLPVDDVATGRYVAYALDVAGNIREIPATSFRVDHFVPVLRPFIQPIAGNYRADDTLSFTANVSEAVYLDVSSPPSLTLQIGAELREAIYDTVTYDAFNGVRELVFTYTVQAGDNDADGISVVTLNDGEGSTLHDGNGNVLIKDLVNMDTATEAVVDTTAPSLFSFGVQGFANAEESAIVSFVFDEAIENFTLSDLTSDRGGVFSNFIESGVKNSFSAIFTAPPETQMSMYQITLGTYADLAGNESTGGGTMIALRLNADTLRPSIISITPVGKPVANATSLSFAVKTSEAVNRLGIADFVLTTARNTAADIINVTGSGSNYLVNLGNIRGDGSLRLDVQPNRLVDFASNVMKESYTSGPVHDVFFPEPPEPSNPLVRFSLIDGVTVKSTTILTAATEASGGKISAAGTATAMSVEIAPVNNSTRIDDPASVSPVTADIPLSFSNNSTQETMMTVSLPDGIGLRADGSLPLSNGDALTKLATFIASVSDQYLDSGKMQVADGAKHFLEQVALAGKKEVAVEKFMLTTSGLTAPGTPITVSGNAASGNDALAQALMIDATHLPKDTVINLRNVDFSVLVGSATLDIQGKSLVYAGDGDQKILLGAAGGEAHGGAGNDTLTGKNGNDRIFGDAGDDTLTGGAGRDLICGGSGIDTAIYAGHQSDYTIQRNGSIFTVRSLSDPTNADTLVNVENIRFDDGTRYLGSDLKPATDSQVIAGLYVALYDRAPDQNGLHHWVSQVAATGISLRDMATILSDVTDVERQYSPALSSGEFVATIYQSILGIDGDSAGRQHWTNQIDNGLSRSGMLSDFVGAVLNFSTQASSASGKDLLDATQAWNMFSNKVAIGLHYAAVMGASSNGDVNSAAYKQSVSVLSGVTDSSQSVEEALVKIDIIGGHAGYGSVVALNALV